MTSWGTYSGIGDNTQKGSFVKKKCQHKHAQALSISAWGDHLILCRECRTVVHWCNDLIDGRCDIGEDPDDPNCLNV